MKKSTLVIGVFFMMTTLQTSAQFGKLLDKVKGSKTEETATGDVVKKPSGKSAGKKSGNFSTVWESQFDNKATRLAVNDGDGSYILGTDDNSATVLDGNGKIVWSGDYKKITTNKTNKCEYQHVVWKDNGGYLFLFDEIKMGADRVAVIDIASGKELWNSLLTKI